MLSYFVHTDDIDGVWSDWSNWARCDNDGAGCAVNKLIYRTRACDNPPQAGTGAPCSGDDREELDFGKLKQCFPAYLLVLV